MKTRPPRMKLAAVFAVRNFEITLGGSLCCPLAAEKHKV